MRKFAGEVIRFLREYYDDAFRYNLTLDKGVHWPESLTLDVKADYLTIHISSNQMYALYMVYRDHSNEWQEQLQELIEM